MKMTAIALTAATLLGSIAVATPALADRVVETHTTVVHRDARHYGPHHRVCRTTWVHHRRVTRCS